VRILLNVPYYSTSNVKIETPATIVTCLPGARALDIKANLKVLANANHKFFKICHYVDTNDVRLCQSDINKIKIKEVCELASTMSDTCNCEIVRPLVWHQQPRSKFLKSPFFSHSDIQFEIQEIALTRTTPLNALKQLPSDWLII